MREKKDVNYYIALLLCNKRKFLVKKLRRFLIMINYYFTEMASSRTPFDFLRMRIPLSILLTCPPVYVRPALPLPAKTASSTG